MDTSPIIPLHFIGNFTCRQWDRRALHEVVASWNIRRARFEAYQRGIELSDRSPEVALQCNQLEKVMMDTVQTTLQSNGGNRTRAAKELGISRRSLLRRIDRINQIRKHS